ncbi:MAG: lipopolysaccharide heptosyltransferase II [Acidobacteriota bacterium]
MERPISKILIRSTNWIGDSIITIPALREIRRMFPEAHLALLAKPWVADLFTSADFLDEIIRYNRDAGPIGFLKFARHLRTMHFDAAILLQNAFEAAALALAAGIPIRIGFPTDGRRFLLTHPLKTAFPVPHEHQIYEYLNIAAQTEALFAGECRVNFLRPQYRLPVSEQIKERMHRLLLDSGWQKKGTLVAINPGATNNPLKRWYPERFALLAEKLLGRENCTVVFIGGPSEESITDEILSRIKRKAIKLTGRTSLQESIAVLSLCDLIISNDTGPAYMAAALCRPTLTIFGPTNYWSISPTSPTARILNHPVSCAPCRLKQCPTNHECMDLISVDQVYSAALKLLRENQDVDDV